MKTMWLGGLLVAAALAVGTAAVSSNEASGRCVWVQDGTHLGVQEGGRVERVRLIGVDDSRASACARQGAAYARSAALNKPVRVMTDRQLRDAQGNTLAWVFLPDGSLLNERLIANGYARLGPLGANTTHAGELTAAETTARTHRLCAWTGEGGPVKPQGKPSKHWSGPTVHPPKPKGGGGGPGHAPEPPRWRKPLPQPPGRKG